MAITPSGAAEVSLSVYGGWVSEVPPESLPENVSPDCPDVAFAPGKVGNRPAFETFLLQSFPAGGPTGLVPTVMYEKSFVMGTGEVRNLYFDSNGVLWAEDFTNSPGSFTKLWQSTPGSFCRSCTFLNREWIAISDGLNGQEIPLQYDGTNLDRVTSYGPGAPPSISNVALPPSQMVASGNTLVRQNNTVTAFTATPHGLQVGYQAQISNVPDSNSTTVNQSNSSSSQTVNSSVWGMASGQYRSLFNPGSSSLSDFVANGFDFTIPGTATILGVVVNFASYLQSASTASIASVALWYTGAQLGTAKTPGTALTTTPTTNSYGSAADLWGGALTPEIVNDPSFGFAFSETLTTSRSFVNFPFTVQVYYTLSGSGTVAEIQSIVINNETNPGQALITTTSPTGLIPGIFVSIVGVEPANVANVSAAQWVAGTTTLTTMASHNLNPGALIQVSGVTTSTSGTTFSFNGTFTIMSVPSPVQLVYEQVPITATDPDVVNATASTGAVTVSWPIPTNTPTPTYFEIQSCPTPTSFYVTVDYSDGTWSSGTVGFIWEGIFYVTAVENPTEFSYYQPGPNGATTAVGTVTPFGQAAPGLHLMACCGLTRQGAITAPSPFVTIIANGGQYLQVSDIPIGPDYWVGRILIFTGAQPDVPGEIPPFFYIPVPAQLEGQLVSTATQINDNTTTSVLLDFSDNTLYSAIGVSIPGNDLENQIVIDGALGFGSYQSRLSTWGQRNTVDNLLNMNFDGGFLPNIGDQTPSGWTPFGTVGGTLVPVLPLGIGARYGGGWQVACGAGTTNNGSIQQGAYQDVYGDPILIGNTQYTFRFFFQATTNNAVVIARLYSPTVGTIAIATVPAVAPTVGEQGTVQGYVQGQFSAVTPLAIPSDTLLQVWVNNPSGVTVIICLDELNLIYSQTPFRNQVSYGSYVLNPEGIDGVSGQYGPQDDSNKIMDQGILRDTLYILTQDPSGRIHETTGSGTSEPVGWQVNEVSANCGTLSAFGLTHSQADDTAASGGDDWMAWPSEGGAMIFGGGQPEKISQEIQPNWYDPSSQNSVVQINAAAALSIWGLNDPVQRLLMFGVPIGTATAPSMIYVLNYHHLNSAQTIAGSPPFHPSFSGKLIATDNSRKWTRWIRPVNSAARMYRSSSQLSLVLGGGNGLAAGTAAGFGNAYILNPNSATDADFGTFDSYYFTYAFLDPDRAQALQLQSPRIMIAYWSAYIAGTGSITVTPYPDNLSNPWPLSITRNLVTLPTFDLEGGGGNAQGNRVFLKIAGAAGTLWSMSRLNTWWRKAKQSVRGAAQ